MIVESPLIKIRSATLEDSEALTAVFREGWRYAYTGIIPTMYLEKMIRERDEAWWRGTITKDRNLLVLDVGDVVAGYATCGRSRGSHSYQGEIFEIYLALVYQGIGLGEYLFEACRTRLDDRHLNGLIVWALADNVTASDFYWRRGGRPIGEVKELFGRTKLSKIAFAWS